MNRTIIEFEKMIDFLESMQELINFKINKFKKEIEKEKEEEYNKLEEEYNKLEENKYIKNLTKNIILFQYKINGKETIIPLKYYIKKNKIPKDCLNSEFVKELYECNKIKDISKDEYKEEFKRELEPNDNDIMPISPSPIRKVSDKKDFIQNQDIQVLNESFINNFLNRENYPIKIDVSRESAEIDPIEEFRIKLNFEEINNKKESETNTKKRKTNNKIRKINTKTRKKS
jgi:hypothetical protein